MPPVTRTGSRASSVGLSDVQTPRRSTRRSQRGSDLGATPLPPIATRDSTSYGSSTGVAPSQLGVRGRNTNLTEVLAGILVSEPEEGGDAPAVAVDKVFRDESSLYVKPVLTGNEPGVLTPGSGARAGRRQVPRTISSIREESDGDVQAQEGDMPAARSFASAFNGIWALLFNLYNYLLTGIAEFCVISTAFISRRVPRGLLLFLSLIPLVFVGMAMQKSDDIASTGLHTPSFDSVKIRVKNYMSDICSKPMNYLQGHQVVFLGERTKNLENRIVEFEGAFQKLENLLPNVVFLEKNAKGQLQIPERFWQALKPHTGLDWDAFIRNNGGKIPALNGELVTQLIEQRREKDIKDGLFIPRAEVMELVRQTKKDLQKELEPLVHEGVSLWLYDMYKQKDKLRKDYMEDFKHVLEQVQIEALAYVNIQKRLTLSLEHVNHFSLNQGAVINPTLTSPTYQFAKDRAGIFVRSILYLIGNPLPKPPPPAAALTKWDEAGDCWCAPNGGSGSGVQLAVSLARQLYPKEVVVEHIPRNGTLEPLAAPKNMEMLVKIEDESMRYVVQRLAEELWPGEKPVSGLDDSWVRIGRWTYDFESLSNYIQIFPLQVNLKAYDVSVKDVIVRAIDNNGGKLTCIYRVRLHGDVDWNYRK